MVRYLSTVKRQNYKYDLFLLIIYLSYFGYLSRGTKFTERSIIVIHQKKSNPEHYVCVLRTRKMKMNCKSIIKSIGSEFGNHHHHKLQILYIILILSSTGFGQRADKPNILWLVAEDMSPRVGIYGDEYAITPTLDILGDSGVIYIRSSLLPSQSSHLPKNI